MADVITLPGVKGQFAIGLRWRHEDHSPSVRDLMAQASRIGAWGAVRKTADDSFQVCSCEPIENIRKPAKIAALGASVADAIGEPWLGVFRLADGRYWLIAVRDGHQIIPNGDIVCSADELDAWRDTLREIGQWEDVREGNIEDVAAMVSGQPLYLRDLRRYPLKTPAYIAVGVFVAMCGVNGAMKYYAHVKAQEQLVELQRQKALAEALRNSRMTGSMVPPWTREPTTTSAADFCHTVWSTQRLANKGWSLSEWDCEVKAGSAVVSLGWIQTGGSPVDAPGNLADDGKTSREQRVFRETFAVSDKPALSAQKANRSLWALADKYDIDLKLLPSAASTAALPGQRRPGDETGKTWIPQRATMSFSIPPWSGWSVAADAIPALRMRSVSWHAAGRSTSTNDMGWRATFDLYTASDEALKPSPEGAHDGSIAPLSAGRASSEVSGNAPRPPVPHTDNPINRG